MICEDGSECVVEVEHRNLERYGIAAEALRKTLDSPGGWSGTLESLAKVASSD